MLKKNGSIIFSPVNSIIDSKEIKLITPKYKRLCDICMFENTQNSKACIMCESTLNIDNH